jgi:outer membrane protein assembly factor BamB
LFSATINGQSQLLVGAPNKDGYFYAWSRTPNAQGQLPVVWQTTISVASPSPYTSSIVSGAWDGTTLYVGGGNTIINGTFCYGSVDALNPATGAIIWQNCQPGEVIAGITAVPGLVVVGNLSGTVQVIADSNGATRFSYSAGTDIEGECTVSNGVVYIPAGNGTLIALGQ